MSTGEARARSSSGIEFEPKPEPPRSRRRSWLWSIPKWGTIALGVLAVLLVALRLALPHFVKNYVNRTLSEIPGYRGRVGDIDIALWRGAYTIHGLDLVKTDGKVPVPFFSTTQ